MDTTDIAPGLLESLRELGCEYGPMGVALAAATLTDVGALRQRLVEPYETNPAAQPATAMPQGYWRGHGRRWHVRAAEGMWTLCGNYANRERSTDPVPEVDVCKSCLKALNSGREWS